MVIGIGLLRAMATVSRESLRVVLIGSALILFLVAMGPLAAWLRRRMDPNRPRRQGAGFELGKLEELRRRGQLSDEEFRTLRRRVLGAGGVQRPGGISSSSAPAATDDETQGAGGADAGADKERE